MSVHTPPYKMKNTHINMKGTCKKAYTLELKIIVQLLVNKLILPKKKMWSVTCGR